MKPTLRAASVFSVVLASALALTACLAPGDARAQAGARSYAVEGDCDGRPATGVRMAPGYCLGLVWQGAGQEGPRMPRGLTPLEGGDWLVTDLGAW